MQSHKYFRTFLPKFHTIWYICMEFLYSFETRSRLMNFQKPYFFHGFPKNTGNYAFFSGNLSITNIFILNAYIYIFPLFHSFSHRRAKPYFLQSSLSGKWQSDRCHQKTLPPPCLTVAFFRRCAIIRENLPRGTDIWAPDHPAAGIEARDKNETERNASYGMYNNSGGQKGKLRRLYNDCPER